MHSLTTLGLLILLHLPFTACAHAQPRPLQLSTTPLEFAKQPDPIPASWTLRTTNVPAIAFTPDNRLLAIRDGKQIQIWDLQTRKQRSTLTDPEGAIRAIALTPDGTTLISGDTQTVKFWDLQTGRLTDTRSVSGPINDLKISADGRMLAVAGSALELWDIPTRQRQSQLTDPGVCTLTHSVTFLPDDQAIAYVITPREPSTGRGDASSPCRLDPTLPSDTVEIRHLQTGEPIQRLAVQSYIQSLAIQGQTLVTALSECRGGDCYTNGKNAIRIWNLKTGQPAQTLDSGAIAPSIALSSDQQTLASTTLDGTVQLWNLGNGTLQQTLTGMSTNGWGLRVAFSPGNQLVILQDNAVTLR